MLLVKDHGLVFINEYSMLQMKANGLRENGLLQILSFANQVFHGIAVADSDNVLGDNWALIQRGRNIVRRGPYHLHSPRVSLMIRSAPGESRCD